MSLIDIALKNVDIESKLKKVSIHLKEKYNKDVGILIFDTKIYLVDVENLGDIDVLETVSLNELLKQEKE